MAQIKKLLLPVIIILLLLCPASYADREDESDFSMRCPEVRYLTLEPDSLDFESSMANMVEGWTSTKVLTARVFANVQWVMKIKGTSGTWEGPYAKPISDIYWSYGTGTPVPLTTDSATVVSGGCCFNEPFPIDIKVKLDMTRDVPGDYYYTYILVELSAP
jgi:hypothetical protein